MFCTVIPSSLTIAASSSYRCKKEARVNDYSRLAAFLLFVRRGHNIWKSLLDQTKVYRCLSYHPTQPLTSSCATVSVARPTRFYGCCECLKILSFYYPNRNKGIDLFAVSIITIVTGIYDSRWRASSRSRLPAIGRIYNCYQIIVRKVSWLYIYTICTCVCMYTYIHGTFHLSFINDNNRPLKRFYLLFIMAPYPYITYIYITPLYHKLQRNSFSSTVSLLRCRVRLIPFEMLLFLLLIFNVVDFALRYEK